MTRNVWAAGLLAAAAAGGCNPGNVGTVKGEVVLDGKPLDTGTVLFQPADGATSTVAAFIKGGAFTAEVPAGNHKLVMSSVYVPPVKPGQNPEQVAGVEVLPAKYNTQTTLTMTVKPGPNAAERFELSTR